MSNLRSKFPPTHRVFQGGRYLRAFDTASDIDHYEHSILTYLGSLMPFDKGFVDQPAFPSIATIARSTKISEATVRKKLRCLQGKGYVKVEAVRFLNEHGYFQQSSNNYFLSDLAFEFFEDVIGSRFHIGSIRKRAVGESFYCPAADPSPPSDEGGYFSSEAQPLSMVAPNSPLEGPKESLSEPGSSEGRNLFSMKGEVDRIVQAWEELIKIPVSKGEKDRFFREYVRLRGNEIYFMERLLPLASDPYLVSRARSINFLFSGLDCAMKNRAEIIQKAGLALTNVQSEKELTQLLAEIPAFIEKKSRNFGSASDTIVRHLLQDPIAKAQQRIGLASESLLPRNANELRTEIQRMLKTGLSEEKQRELGIVLDALPKLSFGYCLELFSRFISRLKEEGAT